MDELYSEAILTKKICVDSKNVDGNIQESIHRMISSAIEGTCIIEGFVKPGSVEIITISSGVVKNSSVIFDVIYRCYICCPVEGMIIKCVAINITKAGIRAELEMTPSPLVIFVARDHFNKSDAFTKVKEDDTILVKIIGQRFELRDKFISVIGEISETQTT